MSLHEIRAIRLKFRGGSGHCQACAAVIPKEYLMDAKDTANLANEYMRKSDFKENQPCVLRANMITSNPGMRAIGNLAIIACDVRACNLEKHLYVQSKYAIYLCTNLCMLPFHVICVG